MKTLLKITTTLCLSTITTTWSGYVLTVLWGWFISPHFGLKELSIPLAIGVAALVSLICPVAISRKNNKDEDFAADLMFALGIAVARPSFALLTGAIAHLFI